MIPTITIKLQSVYGNEYIYPVCDKANQFISLTGRKTFSHYHIKIIKELGFDVIVEQPRLT